MGGDDDHAFAIPDDDVSRPDGDVAAADRNVDVERLVQRQVRRRGGTAVIGGDVEFADFRAVPEAAVGDDTRDTAHHQPRNQDRARGSRPRILPAIHHHDETGWALLHGRALRVFGILKDRKLVQVLAGRDVSKGKGLADHVLRLRRDRTNVLDELVAQAALEEGGA